jgi:hypothetical protein
MPFEITKIESDKLLIVEGNDEKSFFQALLKIQNINDVQIINMRGKDNYYNEFEGITLRPNFNQVKKLGIIKDAETSFINTEKSITNMIKMHNLPKPVKANEFVSNNTISIGYYIMPDNNENGMLENLFLKTLENQPIMDCVNQYFKCIKGIIDYEINEPKSKALVYLAGMKKLVNNVGLAALKNYWNFNHKSMDEIKNFINNFKEF